MAPSPFRRRKAAKTARNLAFAEAALALAKDRVAHSPRRSTGKLLLLGGAVAAVGAVALLKRDKVAGLLPSRTGEPAPAAPPPPQPSNYDAPGPVANTATPIPAPDPQSTEPIDEQAEEAAAAAEASAIGGAPSDYAGAEPGAPADEAQRPLAEAGEGEAEGQEQTEAGLVDNASYRDSAPSDAERQVDETIAQAGQPQVGETPEPLPPADVPTMPEPAEDESPGGGISGRPFSGLEPPGDEEAREGDAARSPEGEAEPGGQAAEAPAGGSETERTDAGEAGDKPASGEKPEDEGSDDWRTWSGRSINP
jgi:hypothetical protein